MDSTTYVLVSMLLSRVVDKGGVGTSSPQSEEAQEQLTLVGCIKRVMVIANLGQVVNIVASCCGECMLPIIHLVLVTDPEKFKTMRTLVCRR